MNSLGAGIESLSIEKSYSEKILERAKGVKTYKAMESLLCCISEEIFQKNIFTDNFFFAMLSIFERSIFSPEQKCVFVTKIAHNYFLQYSKRYSDASFLENVTVENRMHEHLQINSYLYSIPPVFFSFILGAPETFFNRAIRHMYQLSQTQEHLEMHFTMLFQDRAKISALATSLLHLAVNYGRKYPDFSPVEIVHKIDTVSAMRCIFHSTTKRICQKVFRDHAIKAIMSERKEISLSTRASS